MGIGAFFPEPIRAPLRQVYIATKKTRLGRNRLTYRLAKQKHLMAIKPNRNAAPDKALFDELVSEGVVVLRSFFDRDTIARMVTEIEAPIRSVAAGTYSGLLKSVYMPKSGVYRLHGIERDVAPSTRVFFEHPFIRQMATAMSRTGLKPKDSYVDYKMGVGCEDGNFIHHIDHWQIRFKAFLLLSDVGEENAPYVYVKRSHREDRWRWEYDYRFYMKGYDFSTFTPQHVRRIVEKYKYEEISYTGQAGDLILTNTRGIHRGSILREGIRLQLGHVFSVNE